MKNLDKKEMKKTLNLEQKYLSFVLEAATLTSSSFSWWNQLYHLFFLPLLSRVGREMLCQLLNYKAEWLTDLTLLKQNLK